MLDTGLLIVARLLERESASGSTAADAMMRRAVSTAYYALFHAILRAAAQRFVGDVRDHAGAYGLIYRSFDHGQMKRACDELRITTLSERTRKALRLDAVSVSTRDFAGSFTALQDARHIADYDPIMQMVQSDVASLIDTAETALDAFARIRPDERTAVLAFMMSRARA